MAYSIRNAYRIRREYHAELWLDGKLVGEVTRAQDGRGGGYRAADYQARRTDLHLTVATGRTLEELREGLRDDYAFGREF